MVTPDKEVYVIVTGMPPAEVTFKITSNNRTISTEQFQKAPIFLDEHQSESDGPAVKHRIGITETVTSDIDMTVTIKGKDERFFDFEHTFPFTGK